MDENDKKETIGRREFIKKGAAITAAAGATLFVQPLACSPKKDKEFGAKVPGKNETPDLVAIKGGMPDKMFDAGIKAIGGIERFVKKGQTVLVKPNIGWNVPPENGGNTNPLLVKRVVESCLEAGAAKVIVFDHTCNTEASCYKNSGIAEVVKKAGGTMVTGNVKSHYHEVEVPGAKVLKKTEVHEQVINADVFINIPVLKNHMSTQVTSAIKNLMGCIWDRMAYHYSDLSRSIAEFCLYRKPDLNIVDAYTVMTQNGPRGVSPEDLKLMKMQIISPDIVAADAAAIKIYGAEPADIAHVKIAHELGIGNMNLNELKIKKISI